MLRTLKCPVIALEEHYWDKELAALFAGAEGVRDPQTLKRLYDPGELRWKRCRSWSGGWIKRSPAPARRP